VPGPRSFSAAARPRRGEIRRHERHRLDGLFTAADLHNH